MRQLHHNPHLIRDGGWLRKASLFAVQIPVVMELTTTSGVPNTATLDFGSSAAGAHTIDLSGSLLGLLRFNGTFDVGFPGDIEVTFPASPTNTLTTTSVPLEVDSYLSNSQTATTPPPDGCGDFTGMTAGVDDVSLVKPDASNGPVNDVGPPPYNTITNDSTAGDIKVRTGPMSLAIATGANSGGTANLFGLAPFGEQPVQLRVNFSTVVNTLIRVAPADSVYGKLDTYFQCRQFWTGSQSDSLALDLAGTMRMAPSLTAGGQIRLATMQLSSPDTRMVSFAACLAPYQTLAKSNDPSDAPFYPAGPSTTSPYIDPSQASTPPTAACGVSSGPLDRAPFSFSMSSGQSEALAGQFSVTNLTADLLLGS